MVYEMRETRLVREWAATVFPRSPLLERQRLGVLPTQSGGHQLSTEEARTFKVYHRYADGIVIEPGVVHLIEGKIRGQPGALEQLDLYAKLFPLTAEFQQFRTYPLRKHLVWAIADPVVESLARERGVEVHLFHPDWIDDYLNQLRLRQRLPTRHGGFVDPAQVDLTGEPPE